VKLLNADDSISGIADVQLSLALAVDGQWSLAVRRRTDGRTVVGSQCVQ